MSGMGLRLTIYGYLLVVRGGFDVEETYIRTFMSSPQEANIHGFAGFQDIALQYPPGCPSSSLINWPFSRCQINTLPSGNC